MKDKGPVIIHDVDVRDCEYFRWFDSRCSLINCQYGGGYPSCENIPNCQYKRLTEALNQKTAECDKFRAAFENSEFTKFLLSGCKLNFPIIAKYEQALDEIEKNIRHCIKQDICTLCAYADKCRNEFDYNAYDNNIFILDIISKVRSSNGKQRTNNN